MGLWYDSTSLTNNSATVRSASEMYNFNGSHAEGLVIIGGEVRKSFIYRRLHSHSFVYLNILCFDAFLITSYIGRHFFDV